MSKKRFIDSVSVASPCGENWDAMKGNEQIRFCSHCAKDVTNISEMSAAEARRFVLRSKGSICIRVIKDTRGRTISVERPLYQISRAPVFATGLMMATLAMPTAVLAQNDVPTTPDPVMELSVNDEQGAEPAKESFVGLKGKIKDLGAKSAVRDDEDEEEENVWLGFMTVRLLSTTDATAEELTADVDEDGNYEFTDVPAGAYELRIDPSHLFRKKIVTNIVILAGHVTEQDVNLERGAGLAGTTYLSFGGAVAIPMFENDLVRAASSEDMKAARNLLRAGSDPNGTDKNYDDITALFLAVENNDIAMARLLISYGAKVDVKDSSGDTPFSRIDKETSPEIVRLLISRGADPNVRDSEGNTPLMEAAKYGNLELMRLLISVGSDMSATDNGGNTPLMIAAASGEIGSVELLLISGADAGAENKTGENAYDLTSDKKIESLLAKHGSRITQPEYSTATPRLPGAELDKTRSDDGEAEVHDGPPEPANR